MNGGGSKSQLVLASDGRKYVVKLIANPQKTRILANEYVVGRLAKLLGVPSPEVALIQVEQQFVDVVNPRANHIFRAGPAFGSLYIEGDGLVVTPSSPGEMVRTGNVNKWPNAIVLDSLVQNEDLKPEHVLLAKNVSNGASEFWHVDHGHCFGVDRGWSTLNSANCSPRNLLYPEVVSGTNPFEEAFQKLQGITPEVVSDMLTAIPIAQWEVPSTDLDAMKLYLEAAKTNVHNAIIAAKERFPKWSQ